MEAKVWIYLITIKYKNHVISNDSERSYTMCKAIIARIRFLFVPHRNDNWFDFNSRKQLIPPGH
jgi:hypothetical protein